MTTARRGVFDPSTALWVLAVLATLFFLRTARTLLIPIALGVLISYALEPIVAWLAHHRVPRIAGASLVMLVILVLSGWGVYALRDDAERAMEALPKAAQRAREMVMSKNAASPAATAREAARKLEEATGTGGQQDSQEPSAVGSSALGNLVQRAVGSLLALAGHLTAIFFLVFFLLLAGNHFRRRIVEIVGEESRRTTAKIIDDINEQIQRFLLVRVVTSAIVGVATWLVLAWMNVEHAAMWGILAGVFNSIPYFGPVIVSGGLLVVGLVQTGELFEAIKMSGAALAITSLEGWLLDPPLLGKAERMNVVVVFVGLLVWTWLWGGWGTILAVPMMVVIKSIADHVQPLKPVSRLMAP
jgi:predicted PurR-regulated permease PerM